MAEQGYITVKDGVSVNDAIRQVNKEGWQVKQVVSTVTQGRLDAAPTIKYGLLLER